MGITDAGIDPKPDFQAAYAVMEPVQLRDGIEYYLVGKLANRFDLFSGISNAVGMHLLAEFLAAEPRFEERTAGCAVHVLAHQIEHAPG